MCEPRPDPRPVPTFELGAVANGESGPSTPSVEDLRSAFDNAPIAISVLTPAGVVTGCNPALGRLLRRSVRDLVGRTLFAFTHHEDLAQAQANCAAMQQGTAALLRQECRLLTPDGKPVWVSVSTCRVPDGPNRPAHLVMHIEDIGDRKMLEAELQRKALHDPLTGLANRVLLLDRTEHALARAARDGGGVSLLFLDLDGFKAVNDDHGHAAGDRVLIELARRLQGALRPGDTAARLGGDEFAVLCEDSDAVRAAGVASRLRALAGQPFQVDGATLRLTVAVGIGRAGRPGADDGSPATADALLHHADLAMYRAKRAARERREPRQTRPAG